MRILIAEDDSTSRLMLAAVLKKMGHEVLEVADGQEAWAVLQAPAAPRLAILDWMMPEMDGLDVVRRARTLPADRPPYLIMLTTKSEKADIARALDAGADDYLVKPFDPVELRARVSVGTRMVALHGQLAGRILALNEALDQIKTLRGIVPICSSCKKIRDDQGYWNQVDVYVREHTEAEFSHGICPDCMLQLYPDFVLVTERDGNRDRTRRPSGRGPTPGS